MTTTPLRLGPIFCMAMRRNSTLLFGHHYSNATAIETATFFPYRSLWEKGNWQDPTCFSCCLPPPRPHSGFSRRERTTTLLEKHAKTGNKGALSCFVLFCLILSYFVLLYVRFWYKNRVDFLHLFKLLFLDLLWLACMLM